MSDALNHLVKARPEAMGHYFAFLKDCGSRLDPKTRNLISVITKVHAQTERGLRQYLKRALREGCSGEEVLDALLMAFPALGLAKIVWAVDVILAMELPEFAALMQPRGPQASRWHDLPGALDLQPGETRRIEAAGRAVFVHRGADGWRVFDARCPHQWSHLAAEGVVDGDEIPYQPWAAAKQKGVKEIYYPGEVEYLKEQDRLIALEEHVFV